MSRHRHSGDKDGLYFALIALLVLGVPVFVAVRLNNKQADVVISFLDTIKILLIVGTVLVVCYYVYTIFFKSAVEEKRESRREEKRLADMGSVEQTNASESTLPEREPISGSYYCLSCGAWTHIKNEVYPTAICKFCGAALPGLETVLKHREEQYIELYKKQLDSQRDERREQRQLEHEQEMKKLQNEMEKAKLEDEAKEKANKRQHTQVIVAFILLLFVSVLAMAFMGKYYR